MKIALGKLVALFPDGLSLADYQRIGRLIREYGPLSKVELDDLHADTLHTALKRAEENNKIISCC